jgi:D-glycero-D-manno-heptose 1,7-bisphosphate phosphatase
MAMSSRTSAVFLDKDGTLIEDVPYNVEPKHMRLVAGATEALHLLARSGYRLIVVSNQPGVALGLFPEYALRAVEQRLQELLLPAGVSLHGFYYCPHFPRAKIPAYRLHCNCRKPAPGMLTRAARDHALELRSSWLVGDILDDIEAGRRANCKTVLVNNGNETEWELTAERCPHAVATDLLEAARTIVRVDREIGAHTASVSA